jgi:ADP-ribose pyrophosphatase YjhB (NUDIX family)
METRQVFGSKETAWAKRPRVFFCSQCGSKCEQRLIWGLERDVCTSCGHQHWLNAIPFVAVVITDGDKVLLCKRATQLGYGGLWCLPSGHIDLNEDFLTAGYREAEEESGVRVEIQSILSVVSNFWDHGGSTLGIVLLARPVEGTPHPTEESEAVEWFSPDALPELAWEADRYVIQNYFETRQTGAPVDLHYIRAGADNGWTPPPASNHEVTGHTPAPQA